MKSTSLYTLLVIIISGWYIYQPLIICASASMCICIFKMCVCYRYQDICIYILLRLIYKFEVQLRLHFNKWSLCLNKEQGSICIYWVLYSHWWRGKFFLRFSPDFFPVISIPLPKWVLLSWHVSVFDLKISTAQAF